MGILHQMGSIKKVTVITSQLATNFIKNKKVVVLNDIKEYY